MLDKIEQWIDMTLNNYTNQRLSCGCLAQQFKGFYSAEFLLQSYYVVVNKIPKPEFSELRQVGLGNFLDMDAKAITYKDTYFVKKGYEHNLALHFHELVHQSHWLYDSIYMEIKN